jgi:DNA repair exonuclease SbcCD ATPase subunit
MNPLKNPRKTRIAKQKKEKVSGVSEPAHHQPPLYLRDPNAESDYNMKKKIQKALRSKGFHERRKSQAEKFQELLNEVERGRQKEAESARERDQLKAENEKLNNKIEDLTTENGELKNKVEDLTNENGQLKQLICGDYVTLVSIDADGSQNW